MTETYFACIRKGKARVFKETILEGVYYQRTTKLIGSYKSIHFAKKAAAELNAKLKTLLTNPNKKASRLP